MSRQRQNLRGPRPGWQRQIIHCYFSCRHTLPVRLILRCAGEDGIRFDIGRSGSPLRVHFDKQQMCVAAYRQGKIWDLLLWVDYLDEEAPRTDADCAHAQCVELQNWIQQKFMHPVCLRFESFNSGGMTMARLEPAMPLELGGKTGPSHRGYCASSYYFYSNAGA